MSRISRDEVLMESALLWAKRSTCDRGRVGATIARHGRVLMSGYNGVPAGMPHCEHGCTCGVVDYTHSPDCPALNERCDQAIHAEQNAINYCARFGISTHGSHIYVTLAPCISCAKSIISSGITAVIYKADYRDDSGLDLLRRAQLVVHKYDESSTSTPGQERGL